MIGTEDMRTVSVVFIVHATAPWITPRYTHAWTPSLLLNHAEQENP
jgi:hypothetical protein